MIVALTGGTGFVGRAALDRLLAKGHGVRALARRDQPPRDGVEWIVGALADRDSLARLVAGVDAVLHIAGVVNGSEAAFRQGNVDGTRDLLTVAEAAGVHRFVHVSSLAAREPRLSRYGASKAAAEELVEPSRLAWTIVRPPAVYGPGDLDQLDVFRLAKRGLALLPPPGRMSAIMVEDLAALLVALVEQPALPVIYEADDGHPLTHTAYARAIGRALGRCVLAVPLPAPVLRLGARIDRLARGDKARLTLDRARYLAHPDWTADPARRPPNELWTPRITLDGGMAATVAWYRQQGLL